MFGSLNNLAKLNEQTLRLWAQVLQALPTAGITVTSVTDIPSRYRIANALIEYGAAPGQVRVLGPLEEAEFWRIREEIDIVLDAHPYNGTTTTCEALWSGLPVVTLAGTYGASRNTASLLCAVGLQELIATDQQGFVAIAAGLAADIPALAERRAGMRQRLLDAGLCDGPRFTRELENLYRLAWQHWCTARAP
jgi:predicted O-linked N-acetylglucosamine transferase (SPINDLY family)